MPGPKLPALELTHQQRQALDYLMLTHTTPQQVAQRARIILAAAAGLNNAQIARQVGVGADTALLWRKRWLSCSGMPLSDRSVADRLRAAPRAGRPGRITAEQIGKLVAPAFAQPQQSGGPVSQWSSREPNKDGVPHPGAEI